MKFELPNNWKWIKFEKLFAEPLRNGIYKKKEFHGRGYKIINMGELFANPRLGRNVKMKRVELNEKEIQKFKINIGDLIFARRSLTAEGAGQCSIIKSLDEITTYESSIIRVRLNQNIANPGYYYYIFNSIFGKQLLRSILRQVAVSGITGKDLSQLEIPFPPKENQDKLTNILRIIDDKIELNNQINQTLEQIAQAIFKSWFVDFDPVKAKIAAKKRGSSREDIERAAMCAIGGISLANPAEAYAKLEQLPAKTQQQLKTTAALFPDELMESELGDVPKGWAIKRLSEIIKLIGGGTPKKSEANYWGGNIPWFSVKDLPKEGDVFVIDSGEKITCLGLNNSSTRVLPEGTTIITARGTVGKLALVGVPMAMNQSCYGVQGIDKNHYINYFNLKYAVATLKKHTHGAVFDTITSNTFDTVRLVDMPSELKQKFESLVNPSLQKIKNNLFEIKNLKNLRDTLLPKLLSGEILPDQVDLDKELE